MSSFATLSKIGPDFSNKKKIWIEVTKNYFNKKCAPNLLFFNEKNQENFDEILTEGDIKELECWNWTSEMEKKRNKQSGFPMCESIQKMIETTNRWWGWYTSFEGESVF